MIGTLLIQNSATATLIVPIGAKPHLIQNNGINTLYIGDENSFQWNDPTVLSVAPGASFTTDGSEAVWAQTAPNLSTTVNILAGGTSFFQPVTSITLPTGATSGERIVINGLTATITGYNADSISATTGIAYILTPLGIFGYQS